jgi:hypothetical protein
MNGTRHGGLVAMATALVAVTALGATAQAIAPLELVFHAGSGPCVAGIATRGGAGVDDLTVQLRSVETNEVLDSVLTDSDSQGDFEVCFDRNIRHGHKLRASNALTGEVFWFTIPTLTLKANRAKDIVKGKGPANKQVKIRLFRCSVFDGSCVHKGTRMTNVNAAGDYSRDTSSFFNARGFDHAQVSYTNSAGHSYTLDQRIPWMSMELDEAGVLGDLNPGQTATFKLRTAPGGSVLKTRHATQGDEGFSFLFGAPMSAGREVSSDFASDARIKIPSTSLVVDPLNVDGDQIIHVRCLPDRKMLVDLNPGADIYVMGDDHGRATLNLSDEVSPGFQLSIEEVRILCTTPAGDLVARRHPPVAP